MPKKSAETKKPRMSFDKRLAAYSAMATAAGVGLLGMAGPASAEVVFTPSNAHVGCGGTFLIDINNDGVTDFELVPGGYYHQASIRVTGPAANEVIANQAHSNFAVALQPGALIAPNGNFRTIGGTSSYGDGLVLAGNGFSYFDPFGPFAGTHNRALGIRFQINGQTHYGWVGFRHFHKGCSAQLAGWAYETVADRPIRAGQTHGISGDVSIEPQSLEDHGAPVPATPDVLALGSLSLDTWRVRK